MTRVTTLDGTKAMLDVLQKHGHNEVDTARLYGQGSSEEYLGEIDWQKRGIIMETKLYPNGRGLAIPAVENYTHTAEDVRRGLLQSFKALKAEKIDMWYLHGPDRSIPFEVTLREVNKLHKEGYFNRFGISNYMSWEVAQICEICEKNGWIKPGVYQGIYNALHRAVEPELIPCLRHYGIALYSFQPLAGGFLTGRYQRNQTEFEKGSRFDLSRMQGKLSHGRYWNDAYFDALEVISPVVKKHGLTLAECALRWLTHHSALNKSFGDAIIIGASSPDHLENNLVDLEKGPLPEEVVQAFEAAWPLVRAVQFKYWH
jgi:aflatoxin B1 aldehyde reductase